MALEIKWKGKNACFEPEQDGAARYPKIMGLERNRKLVWEETED